MIEVRPPHSELSLTQQVQAYASAILMVAACTLVGEWIAPRWGTAPVDMVYLPAVLAAAAFLFPSVVCSGIFHFSCFT